MKRLLGCATVVACAAAFFAVVLLVPRRSFDNRAAGSAVAGEIASTQMPASQGGPWWVHVLVVLGVAITVAAVFWLTRARRK